MKIAHLSDLHIKDGSSQSAARRLFTDIQAHYSKDEIAIVVTGDIIDSPDPRQWQLATEVFRPVVESGYLIVPALGNHDVALLGLKEHDHYRAMANRWLDEVFGLVVTDRDWPITVYAGEQIAVVVANTNIGTNGLARGSIGYLQRMRIAQECQRHKSGGRQVVLAMHHHPKTSNESLRLTDAEELLHALSHRCDVLLCGHLHEAAAWSDVWGVGRIYASCNSTRTRRYRILSCTSGVWRGEWFEV